MTNETPSIFHSPFDSLQSNTIEASENRRSLLSFVLQTMKYNVLHRFSPTVTKPKFQASGLEGFYSGDMVVNTKCDMISFVYLVKPLHNSNLTVMGTDFYYSPSVSAFINPSRATSTLSVDFRDLHHLLQWLHIRDSQDLFMMGCRQSGTIPSGTLRLLGSTFVVKDCRLKSSESVVDIDCVVPFGSATISTYYSVLYHLQNSIPDTSSPKFTENGSDNQCRKTTVYYRSRENYNEVQGRYLSQWNKMIIKSSFLSPSDTSTNSTISTFTESMFSIQWSPLPPLPPKIWTSDATFVGPDVMGEVSIFFPSVTFFGSSISNEIRSLTNFLSTF